MFVVAYAIVVWHCYLVFIQSIIIAMLGKFLVNFNFFTYLNFRF